VDIPRPEIARRKRVRRWIYAGTGTAAVLLVTLGVSRLRPAAPTVEAPLFGTVKRGELVRNVRGMGTLVPEEIRWIPATTEGRVERIVLQAGTPVTPDSVILELSNPELEVTALDAESQLRAAEATSASEKVRLESQLLDQQATAARIEAEHHQAKLRADADEQLAKEGLVADLNLKISKTTAEELGRRYEIEKKRLAIAGESIRAQLAVQEARVEQQRALARLRRSQVQALKVRAGMEGILQQVPVEVGQRVSPGANLARVARQDKLKAVVRIAETQARDVQLGQKAEIDTRNGKVLGHVIRIDPASQNATVAVDLAIDEPLPKGARPDLTVDGTIEFEHLKDVLFIDRPAQAQAESTIGLFRVVEGTNEAVRVTVKLGRGSVTAIEVVEGLQEGDRVILSDTSNLDGFDRVRVN
jgi:HlyD family secretion protein